MDLSQISELDLEKGQTKFYKDEVLNIYYRALCNASSWDIGLGFFSLSAMKLLAYPLSKFLINNEGAFFSDIINLKNALEVSEEELFGQCIAYLIHENILELKVLLCNKNSIGISHHKNSIFKDDKSNIVVLSGSANASEQAFVFNREDTNAFCSFWKEKSPNKTIKRTIEEFEDTFANGDEGWKILEIDSKELKEKLNEIGFRKINRDGLKGASQKF